MLFVDCVLREVPCIFDFGTSKNDGRRNMLVFLPERKGAWEKNKWIRESMGGVAKESRLEETAPTEEKTAPTEEKTAETMPKVRQSERLKKQRELMKGGAGEEQETEQWFKYMIMFISEKYFVIAPIKNYPKHLMKTNYYLIIFIKLL